MIKFPSTPWEDYEVNGCIVHVKREDMCCMAPGPTFSKVRGVYEFLSKVDRSNIIGVMDTRHSMAGWGVTYVATALEMQVWDFYPELKGDSELRHNQKMCKKLGAWLYPMKAGMSAVLYNQAKKILTDNFPGGSIMMPNGLKLQESVDATAKEVMCVPTDYIAGSWVISISSGTLAAGVIKGLAGRNFTGKIILHMGYSRSSNTVMKYVSKMSGCDCNDLHIIDDGYEYKDKVDNSWIPFPCNEYYDAKAFTWLTDNVHKLKQPIVFWNIGS